MASVTISAGSQIAADAGADIARQGGNAVDAALAATLVSMITDVGVMAPGASGFLTIWPPEKAPVVIDAYANRPGLGLSSLPTEPGAREVFFDYGGRMSNVVGYDSVATPGIFRGLGLASDDYGKLPWDQIMRPAIGWAERGFPLTGGRLNICGTPMRPFLAGTRRAMGYCITLMAAFYKLVKSSTFLIWLRVSS